MALSFRYQPSPDLNPSPHPIIPPDHPHDQPYHPPPPTPSPLPSPPPGAGIQGDWYVYQPLPSSNHIRLLELKESSSPPGFECSLQIVDLDTELLSYEALSYTWGCHWYTSGYKNRPPTERDRERDAQRSTILCDGKLIWIRLNLYNALGRLFKTRGENQTQTYPKLWVDAICINQEDLDERAQQVALMGNIYASATRVIAWLGECD
ncbi:HET-domain-containing protein, partial [Patellaria atrata CBS 101060]